MLRQTPQLLGIGIVLALLGFGWTYPYYDPFYWDDGGYWYPRYRTHYRSYYREPYRRVYTRPYGRNYGEHRYRGTVTPRSGATYRAPATHGGGTSGSGTTRVRTQVSPRSGGVSGRTTTTRRR